MKASSRSVVHRLVAAHADIGARLVDDEQTLERLGLDPLDLILIVVQVASLEESTREFPLDALDSARTVGDLVALVDAWRARAVEVRSVEGRAP